ncbi:PAS domain-containing protein [Desulfatirhabdium butyrativorans]|uniref:PAS domain-containing protein n=1 Tax=Desulfatirhabdium butyrativorans TaxID=340467 RepID=UPI0004074567|nr:PAS domain S-box protein [Desulfatirhabdium butyrativorans]
MTDKPSYAELERRIVALEMELEKRNERDRGIIQTLTEDFEQLADRSQDGIYQYDIESRTFPFFNKAFLELFSLEIQGVRVLSPKSVLVHIHPDDLSMVRSAQKASLEPGSSGGEIEYRFLHPDGSIRWMHDRWTVLRNASGQAMTIEGVIRDNTLRKQAEQEIMQAMRNALIGSYLVQKGKFLYVNREFVRISAYSENELIGTDPLRIVRDDFREFVREHAVRMLKGLENTPYEFCVVDRKGETKWVMESVTPIMYRGNRAVLGYFMDITKNKRAEEDRKEKEKLQAVLELAGAVGHELNNPLQVVLTCSQKLGAKPAEDPLRQQLLNLLQKNIQKIVEITRKFQGITQYATKEYVRGKRIIDIHAASRMSH